MGNKTKHIIMKKWQVDEIIREGTKKITRKTFDKICDQVEAKNEELFDGAYDVEEEEYKINYGYIDVVINNVLEARIFWGHQTKRRGKKCDSYTHSIRKGKVLK